jgi:hypothetical protein
MSFWTITLAAFSLAADSGVPATRPDDPVQQAAERGLDFLAQKGTAWQEQRKCSSCHHLPMVFWSHHEARRKGLPSSAKVLEDVEAKALLPYLENPKVQPKGDGSYVENKKNPGPEMVYLLAAAGSEVAVAAEQTVALERYLRLLLDSQEANGSWTLKNWEAPAKAPIYETSTVYTLWVLLALRAAERTGLPKETLAKSREQALAYIDEAPVGDTVQEQAMRLVVSAQFGKADATGPLLKKLLALQHGDGGWSHSRDGASDALATGQALFALRVAGVSADDPGLQRAQQFLVKTQQRDGSWKLANANRTFFGTGWATLGLLQSLRRSSEPK